LIKEKNDFVDVEFYRRDFFKVTTENDRLATENDRLDLDEKIIEYLKNNKKITKKTLKEILNVKDTKAKKVLNEMIDKNVLKREGAGRSTYYILIE